MEWLPVPRPGSWALVIAPHAGAPLMLDLTARLGSRGPVGVVDGGDRFQAHVVSRAVRRYLPPGSSGADLPAALERILLARAFTCYQMVTLLDEYLAHPLPLTRKGRWFPRGRAYRTADLPARPAARESRQETFAPTPPTLVLDLLSTFYDESVPLVESQRLLDICIAYLHRMAERAPLAVSVKLPRPESDRLVLVERLENATAEVYRLELPESVEPPRLFFFGSRAPKSKQPPGHLYWSPPHGNSPKETHYGKNSTIHHPGLSTGTGSICTFPPCAAPRRPVSAR